uniref:Secreted protein n=1 Tax=Achlya hypogyna TaxID=1202772 RepID=A0A0A7CPN3_ACHHY|nr:secreted protein [Achlya hypogyna]
MKVFPYGRQLALTLPLLLLKAEQGDAQALGSILGGSAKEGNTLSFVCPAGEVISQVLFASYGTPTGTLPNYVVGWCAATQSVAIVQSLCLGAKSCKVRASDAVFGDPCYGTVKRLNAVVQCVDESIVGGRVPDGATLRLACPANQKIGDVAFASYGTSTGSFPYFSTGKCNAPTSTATIASLCLGRPSCDVAASPSVFGGDPCKGTNKTLAAQVNCINLNAVEATVPEGSVLNLACPAGSTIASIDFASYGTPSNYFRGSCHAASSTAIVTQSCVGQPACQIAAIDDVFDDPCPTKTKKLSVQAECSQGLPPGIIEATAVDGTAALLVCPPGQTISDIAFASYGTPTGFVTPSWCNAPTSVSVVESACLGNSFCTVDANAGVFGDPCPGTTKSLNIAAQCSSADWIGGSVPAGSSLTLKCPPNQKLISFPFASYGTPIGSYPNFVPTWCDSNTTDAVASAACLGQNSCTLTATNGAFGDPCPGIAKQLSVIAECAAADLIGGSTPQSKTLTLQCPPGEYIGSIPFVSYGTPTGSYPNFVVNPSCNAPSAASTVNGECLGNNNCTITASSGVFGDPCPGTAKFLGVTAKCVPNNVIGTQVTAGSNAVLQCPSGSYISAIDFASFGTPQGTFPDFSIKPACHAATSLSTVAGACVGLNSCVVPATTSNFADPCIGTDKTLAIVGECISNNIIGAKATQGSMLQLSCPAGKAISTIDFASYGTATGNVGGYATSSCHDPNSAIIVQQACLGKPSCTVSTNNGAFADTCYGTLKYLTVQATCATPPPLPQIIGGSVAQNIALNLTCPMGQAMDAIMYASYGITTGAFPNYANGWCNSPYSMDVVSFLCLGQESCSIPATDAVFSNPCIGAGKLLSVVAHCAVAPVAIVAPPNTDPTIVDADAADGSTLSLQCPGNFVVGPVLFASYGTSAVHYGSNTASWCHAPASVQAVQGACAGRNACSIVVAPKAPYFGGDPCPGISKHLAVQVQCVDPNLIGGLVPDESVMPLVCRPGQVIGEILYASYGTPTGDVSLFETGWCDSAYSKNVVTSLCLNQPFCTIPVNSGTFSDPCVGIAKSLAVEARCTPAPVRQPNPNIIGGTAAEGSTLALQCKTPGYVIGPIAFASFGTPSGTGPANYTMGSCNAQTTAPIVNVACNGKATCVVPAQSSYAVF